jgi:hypothetical protein
MLAAAFAGIPIGILWERLQVKWDKRRSCDHRWGRPFEAMPGDWKKECVDCGAQKFCDRDGRALR